MEKFEYLKMEDESAAISKDPKSNVGRLEKLRLRSDRKSIEEHEMLKSRRNTPVLLKSDSVSLRTMGHPH